ncbi:hypothetical protein FRC07_014423, partial [Ceratobasidium sp. 392]
ELALLFTGAKAPTKDSPNEMAVTSSVKLDPEGINVMVTPSVEPDAGFDTTNTGSTPAFGRELGGSVGTPHHEPAIGAREMSTLETALDKSSVAELHVRPPAPEGEHVLGETQAPPDAHGSISLSDDEYLPKAEPPSSITEPVHAQASAVETSKALGVAHPLFTIAAMGVDRRLLVNRKRQLQMYRVYVRSPI